MNNQQDIEKEFQSLIGCADEQDLSDNPEWEKADRVHDWRNHVPNHVKLAWSSFSKEVRQHMFAWARAEAARERWD